VTDAAITQRSLLNLLFIHAGSSTGRRLFAGARLLSVEVWGIDDGKAVAGMDNIALTWGVGTGSGIGAPGLTVSEYGNAMHPGHFKVSPPEGSNAGLWQTAPSADQIAFLLTCGSGSVIDVTLEWVMQDSTLGTTTLTTGTGTAGLVYQGYLDGTTVAGAQGTQYFVPQGPRTTVAGY